LKHLLSAYVRITDCTALSKFVRLQQLNATDAIGGKGACQRVCTVGHGSSLIGSEAANNAPTKERGGRRRVS